MKLTPGEQLIEWLDQAGMSQTAFAAMVGIPIQRVNGIITGIRNVSPESALLLAEHTNIPATRWLALQNEVDLKRARRKMVKKRGS
jgi:addiction module HigA family antidote